MRETLKHREAFEAYYRLGDDRNLKTVADRYNVGKRTTERWSREFNWQERILQRDLDNGEKLKKKTDQRVVSQRAEMLKEIDETLGLIRMTIRNSAIIKNGEVQSTKIDPTTARDLASLAAAQEKLISKKLLLLGEVEEKKEQRIIIEHVNANDQSSGQRQNI